MNQYSFESLIRKHPRKDALNVRSLGVKKIGELWKTTMVARLFKYYGIELLDLRKRKRVKRACCQCKIEKERKSFYETSTLCIPCHQIYCNNRNYLKRYGITEEIYYKMWNSQKGRCAICQKTSDPKRLCVDHNHKTNKVRGLLCITCNAMIGYAHENTLVLDKARQYLSFYRNIE